MDTNKESKLSVIVPVYNVREYVEECIESILNQTYTNLEVLLIINAPTDGSDKVCESYAQKDTRVRLIYISENRGVYPAWYAGGMNATGDYVTFVDADDYIDAGYFQEMMEALDDHDMAASYHRRITAWNSTYEDKTRIKPGDYSATEEMNTVVAHMFDQDFYMFFAPWAKIYKTAIIRSALWEITACTPGGIPGYSDYAIFFANLVRCNSLKFIDCYGYNYRMRKGSDSRKISQNYLVELDAFYKGMRAVFEKDKRRDLLIDKLEQFVQKKIVLAGRYLGFADKNRIPQYFLPVIDQIKGKRIALYSASDVACDYRQQIQKQPLCQLVLWVSGNWEERRKSGLPIDPVNRLLEGDYDYVLIAVKRQSTADSIIRDLTGLGLGKEKLLWKKPICLFD